MTSHHQSIDDSRVLSTSYYRTCLATVVPQFLVLDGFYFCFLWTWQTRYFLLSKTLFNAYIVVLRGVTRRGFGEKFCLHLQSLQRLYIIQDAFVPYVTFQCKAITYSVVHLMEDVYPFMSILHARARAHTQVKCGRKYVIKYYSYTVYSWACCDSSRTPFIMHVQICVA